MSQTKRIFPLSLLGFVAVAVLVLVLGLAFFAPSSTASAGALSEAAVAARLAPVATVEFASSAPAHAPRAGKDVYAGLCVACHGAGVAGAPKLGDKGAWKARIAQGYDTLLKHAIEGYKGMPAKGGGADLDPQEVARAVAWIADQGGGRFKEP